MASLTRRASDVRISEIDLSSSLTGASPSTAALVVVSAKGPQTPTFFSTADDFRAAFGDPDARVSFDHYCALDFFKGGNSMWAVRACGAGYRSSGAMVKLNSSLETVLEGLVAGVATPTSPDFVNTVIAGETALYQITAKNGPGSHGDAIEVEIESENITTPTNVDTTTTTLGGTLLAATYEYSVSAIGKSGETLGSAPATVVIGGVSVTNTVTVTWDRVPGAIGYRIYGRAPGTPMYLDQVGGGTLSYTDTGLITPDATRLPITNPLLLPAPSPIFYVKVYDTVLSGSRPVEQFTCSVTEQVDDTGLQMEITQRINPYSRYIRVESNVGTLVTTPTIGSTLRVALAGGYSGAAPTSADINAAWRMFLDTSMYQIDMLINAGRALTSVQLAMDALAQSRGDCVAHLDCPQTTNSAQDVIDYRRLTLNLNSSYSTLNCSDALEADPINGKLLYVPFSGLTCGLQARVARTAQPWLSIAGLNRGRLGISDVRLRFDDGEATLLYQNQLSYPRRFVGKGIAWWEANTLLDKNSALQFLNIRVLCNVIKRACYDYLVYGLQEPGDDILRKQLQFSLETYLETVKNGRGISKAQVVITGVNNPVALMNSGILGVAVIITPVIAVREIQLSLAISKEGLTITEAEIASFGG